MRGAQLFLFFELVEIFKQEQGDTEVFTAQLAISSQATRRARSKHKKIEELNNKFSQDIL